MLAMSIRTKILGFIATWFFSLLLSLVGAAIKRSLARQRTSPAQKPAFKDYSTRQQRVAQPASDPAFKTWAVTDTIFQGMTSSELVATYGEPSRKSHQATDREVWIYAPRNVSNDLGKPGMTVTLESGVVTDWAESGAA